MASLKTLGGHLPPPRPPLGSATGPTPSCCSTNTGLQLQCLNDWLCSPTASCIMITGLCTLYYLVSAYNRVIVLYLYNFNRFISCLSFLFKIYYCSSRWPGSVHDSRVLRNSSLMDALEQQLPFPRGIILGDSGYACSDWLITPVGTPHRDEELRFNTHHKRMRRLIECCNGVLKERFRCLKFLHLEPKMVAGVVKACCVLRNFILDMRSEQFDIDEIDMVDDVIHFNVRNEITTRRDELINHFISFP